jgi:hypothetical protein
VAQNADLALKVVSKTLSHEVSIGVADVGKQILAVVIGAALGAPVASLLGSVAGALIEELFDSTQSIDRKLNAILNEPLRTATSTLKEMFSVDVTTVDEDNERNRQLALAFDNLRRAHSIAGEMDDAERAELIRLYQCVAAAAMPGGGAILKLWLPELRESANIASKRAARCREQAAAIEDVTEEDVKNAQEFLQSYGPEGQMYGGGVWQQLAQRSDTKAALNGEAINLDRMAKEMDQFCDFVLLLANNRSRVLPSPRP